MSRILLAAVLALFVVVPTKAGVWDEACKTGPEGSSEPCVNINNNLLELKSAIEGANDGDFIVFCPFEVESTREIKPKRQAAFACATAGACVFFGGTNHIKFSSLGAETLFYGFTFKDATESAVFVRSKSPKEQLLCDCLFERNIGDKRGGAMRLLENTRVTVHSSNFVENSSSSRGGAIYNRGFISLIDSSFTGNSGKEGGAMGSDSDAFFTVTGCLFENNAAEEGPALWSEYEEGDLEIKFQDGGENVARNNGDCNGLYNEGDDDTCYEFPQESAPSVSPAPSPKPSITEAPVTSSPMTAAPVTSAPVTSSPVTAAPVSSAPVAASPVTAAPVTSAPVTASPVTAAPVTSAPVTASPVTAAPVTSAPVTTSPVTAAPVTSAPVEAPTEKFLPAEELSLAPTNEDTTYPTYEIWDSFAPSPVPTRDPESPTTTPTISAAPVTWSLPPDPDEEKLPLVDREQPKGYFNFNVDDDKFGPDAWGDVEVDDHNEYKIYEDEGFQTGENECGKGGIQSPIDLHRTNYQCEAIHQIRAKRGDWRNVTREGEVLFQVTPRNLRVEIRSDHPKRPNADAPDGFKKLYTNHFEVHTPSLHTFNGKRFDAEYVIYHVDGEENRILVLSVVIDAEEDKFNREFQKLLNAWGLVDDCGIDSGRRLVEAELAEDEEENDTVRDSVDRHLVKIDGKFNIYHVDLVPSIYWYAYSGSLIHPPCTRSAHWRVTDTPMKISHDQLILLRAILSQGACRDDPMRKGLGPSLVRPTQNDDGRPVWQCTAEHYDSDCERFNKLCPDP